MKVWFENSYGQERIIGEAKDWEKVNWIIDDFIAAANGRKPKDSQPFIRYYTRVWVQEDGRTRIDVGSHTEFFIWEGKYNDSIRGGKDL